VRMSIVVELPAGAAASPPARERAITKDV